MPNTVGLSDFRTNATPILLPARAVQEITSESIECSLKVHWIQFGYDYHQDGTPRNMKPNLHQTVLAACLGVAACSAAETPSAALLVLNKRDNNQERCSAVHRHHSPLGTTLTKFGADRTFQAGRIGRWGLRVFSS